jgi:hypothetical protein
MGYPLRFPFFQISHFTFYSNLTLVNRNVAQDSILVFADEAHFRLIASFLAMTCLESWATMGLCFNLPKSS